MGVQRRKPSQATSPWRIVFAMKLSLFVAPIFFMPERM
jgi:hypothetical protein